MDASTTNYRCLSCGLELQKSPTDLVCRNCHKSYPIVAGIPVLTPRPEAMLRAFRERMQFRDSRSAPSPVHQAGSLEIASNANQRSRACSESNFQLTTQCLRPILDRPVETSSEILSLVDAVANRDGGWPSAAMFPYFYQDWSGTAEFRRVKALIIDAMLAHRPDAQCALVLGSGAGGLVHALAEHCESVYGIDLSLPVLLIAKRILDGSSVSIGLEDAACKIVDLHNPQGPSPNVQLVTADASYLPFKAGTASLVITQYLMDVVGNPARVASQICNVLKHGGIWINFSLPFSANTECSAPMPVNLSDLPNVLQQFGLAHEYSKSERFSLLDLTDIDPDASTINQAVHFFIARKISCQDDEDTEDSFLRWRWTERDSWWARVPQISNGQTVRIVTSTDFTTSGRNETTRSSIGRSDMPLTEENASQVRTLFELIDGRRSTKTVYSRLLTQGFDTEADDFRELLNYLEYRDGLIRLRPATSFGAQR